MAERNDDAKLIETARKRFDYCIDATGTDRELKRDDMKFYAGSPDNGWQWPDKVLHLRQNDPNGARPCLTINKLPQHVRHITNEQRQNRPSIKVVPVDSRADPEVADIINGVIRHIEYQSDADTAYDTACETQVAMGEGYFRVVTDYADETSFDQEIFIRRIPNIMSVYLDPDRQDPTGSDMRFAFIVDEMRQEEFEAAYPNADPVDWEQAGLPDYRNWYLTGEKKVRVAEYFYYEDERKQITDGGRTRAVNRRIVKWCKLTGDQVLQKRDVPGRWIPVIEVIGNEFWIDGIRHTSGIVRNVKDSQRMYNYWASQETELLALAPKAPFIGAAGQFEGYETRWQQANTKNFSYLEYNPVVEGNTLVPPPQRAMPPMPSAGILEAKRGAADDIKSETGQYDPSLGSNPQSQSGVALAREQKKSEVVNFHFIDNLSKSIRHAGRIILAMLPEVMDTRRVASIVGEDGETDQALIDPSIGEPLQTVTSETGAIIAKIFNPRIGRYDVRVTVGPSYTTQRQETAQMLVELSQGATDPVLALVMRYLAVKNMDWSGATVLADTLKKLLPPQLQQEEQEGGLPPEIQAHLQAAQQMIQEKEQEIMQVAQQLQEEKLTVDQAKAELTRLMAEVQAAQAELKAQSDMLAADKQLALKDIQLANAGLESKVSNALTKIEKSEVATAGAGDNVMQMMQAMTQVLQGVMQGFEQVAQAVQVMAAPRETRIITDESGMPVGAVSEPARTTLQ